MEEVSKYLCVVCEIYMDVEFLFRRFDLGKQILFKDKVSQCRLQRKARSARHFHPEICARLIFGIGMEIPLSISGWHHGIFQIEGSAFERGANLGLLSQEDKELT